ncbi:MAG: hypothetical protein WBA62_16160 [Xanthobacteraceae bacterium]
MTVGIERYGGRTEDNAGRHIRKGRCRKHDRRVMRVGPEGVIHSFDQSDDVNIIFRHIGDNVARNRRVIGDINSERGVDDVAIGIRRLHRESQADGIRARRVIQRAEQVEAIGAMRRRRIQCQRKDARIIATPVALIGCQNLAAIGTRRHNILELDAARRQRPTILASDRQRQIDNWLLRTSDRCKRRVLLAAIAGQERQRPPEGITRAGAAQVVVRAPIDMQVNRAG